MISLPELVWVKPDLAVAIVPGERHYHDGNTSGARRSDGQWWCAHEGCDPPYSHDVEEGEYGILAPQEWAQYHKPCENFCGDIGESCPDCRDGHQVLEVRWTTEHRIGSSVCFDSHSAWATLHVVPVVTYNSEAWADLVVNHPLTPYVDMNVGNEFVPVEAQGVWLRLAKEEGTGRVMWSEELLLDPLPVVGQDFILVVNLYE